MDIIRDYLGEKRYNELMQRAANGEDIVEILKSMQSKKKHPNKEDGWKMFFME